MIKCLHFPHSSNPNLPKRVRKKRFFTNIYHSPAFLFNLYKKNEKNSTHDFKLFFGKFMLLGFSRRFLTLFLTYEQKNQSAFSHHFQGTSALLTVM